MVGRQDEEEKCVIKSFRIYALYALPERSLRRSKQKVWCGCLARVGRIEQV